MQGYWKNEHTMKPKTKTKMGVRDETGLTPQEKIFCVEYCKDFNGSAAAIRAAYTPKSGGTAAWRLLKRADVATEIQRIISERSTNTNISVERVLNELAKIAFSDFRNFVNDENVLLQINEMQPEQSAAIAAFEASKFPGDNPLEMVKIKLYDKKGALELIGKHLGMFADIQKHIGDINININRKVISREKTK